MPGLLEISYWNLKRKNAVTGGGQLTMARLVQAAQSDKNIKVIFIHGGLFYCSGNELTALADSAGLEREEQLNRSSYGAEHIMHQTLMALHTSKKPVVGLVRG